MFKAKIGVRGRILAIALLPCITLLAVGVGVATYLVDSGLQAQDWAVRLREGTTPTVAMVEALQQERQLTLLRVTGTAAAAAALPAARARVDAALRGMVPVGRAMAQLDPDAISATVDATNTLLARMPTIRADADKGRLSTADAYAYYSQTVDTVGTGSLISARVAPDASTSVALTNSMALFRATEAMSRAHALATAALRTGTISFTPDELREYNHQIGYYRTTIAELAIRLDAAERADLNTLTTTESWHQSTTMEDAISALGAYEHTAQVPALPLNTTAWQASTDQVATRLLELWRAQNVKAQQSATDAGARIATNSLLGGVGALLIALVTFAATFVLANRFIGRLARLRADTLLMADEQLPKIVAELREGSVVDTGATTFQLEHGDDEIGDVADAFNRAQQAAVAAAVAEARTRSGINAVFLNIAYRSQVVAHRQLEVLDKAEHETADPTHLQTLFQLDHLATRARRHAENLIILGGGQPGRQWRNPVPLFDLVRSAIGETLEYTRVRARRMPQVHIAGNAVADLVHLLAELMDNATAFSPPDTRVEVDGRIVGRGFAVEINDQGLGMTAGNLTEHNDRLRTAPDFSLAELSGDSRLGLFVVAKLASRHGISVRLSESVYGGLRAIVLIPTALVTDQAASAVALRGPDSANGQTATA